MSRSLRPRKSINYLEMIQNKSPSNNSSKRKGSVEAEQRKKQSLSGSDFEMNDDAADSNTSDSSELSTPRIRNDDTTDSSSSDSGESSDSNFSSSEMENEYKKKKKKLRLSNEVEKKKTGLSKPVVVKQKFLAILGADEDSDEAKEYKLQREKNMMERLNVLKTMDFGDEKYELGKQLSSPIRPPVIPPKTTRRPPRPRENNSAAKLGLRKSTRLSLRSHGIGNDTDTLQENAPEEKEETVLLEENLNLTNYQEDKHVFLERIKSEINVPYNSVNDFLTCDFDKFSDTVRNCHMFDEPTKVIPSRIVSMDFHRSESRLLLLAGDKLGNISLWDVGANEGVTLKGHQYNVYCVSFSVTDATKFYSTSLDGTTRIGDINENSLKLLLSERDSDNKESHTTWHHELRQTLMIGRGDGCVKLLDLRAPSEKALVYKCHQRSVRTIQTNPNDDNYFLTSSSTGSFGIFDLRKIDSKHQSAVIMEDLGRALTSAFYSATGAYVLTTSNDDTVRIYDCRENKCKQLVRIPHSNHGGRWLSVFRARWQPQREDCFYVGSMQSKPRRIQAYKLDGRLLHEFSSPLMETYTPVVTAHPSKPIIVGGNSSGRIHVFSPFQNLNEFR